MKNWKAGLALVCLVIAVVLAVAGIAFTWSLVNQYGSQALSTLAIFGGLAIVFLLAWFWLRRS